MFIRTGFLRCYSPDDNGGAGNQGGDGGAGGAGDDDGSGDDGGADDQNEGNEGGGGDSGAGKKISPADHERALKDLQRYKQRARESTTRLANLERELQELKAGKDGKKADDLAAKLSEEQQRNKDLQTSIIESQKFRELVPALKKAGLTDGAENLIEMLDLEDLDHEVTSKGRVNIIGLESFVEDVKKRFPYAFASKKTPRVNGGGSGTGFGDGKKKWDGESLFKLEKECRKKGEMTKYHAAVKEYLQQKKEAK